MPPYPQAESERLLTTTRHSAEELARLAWAIVDAASKNPQFTAQLSGQEWIELGRFMASVVFLFMAPEEEPENANPAATTHHLQRENRMREMSRPVPHRG